MEKIIFKREVLEYLDDLFEVLFYKEYFGFQDTAIEYVDKIVAFIYESIENFPHKTTPKPLKHLGSKYIFYKSNSRTVWYIFFETKNQKHLITGIINNHTEQTKHL